MPTFGRVPVHEIAVAATDLALGIEGFVLAGDIARRPVGPNDERARSLRGSFVAFFAATATAATAGAALHGLFPNRNHPTRRRLWRLSLGAIAVGSLAGWRIGAWAGWPAATARRIVRPISLLHAAYLAVLSRTSPPFAVAIATYLPGGGFLGWGLARRLRDRRERRSAATALLGLGLTFVAAWIQARRVAVHRRWFDHNALYHTVQAFALLVFHRAAAGLLRSSRPDVPVGAGPGPV
jgi:hypothetical protein